MRQSRRSPDASSGSAGRNAGSSEPEYLIVGEIIRPHGVRGDVAMKAVTAYPERLSKLETLYVGDDFTPYRVKRARQHRDGMLLLFESVADRNQAEELRGQTVYVHIDDAIPLEEGEFYLYQLEGIRVVTDEGVELGELTDYIETGANDVYIITTPDGDEVLIPAIPDVIQEIDLEEHTMTVKLLEGLL